MYHPEKDFEARQLSHEVTMDEARLDLLDDKIEEQRAHITKLLNEVSDAKRSMSSNKIEDTDDIEAMELREMLAPSESLSLSAYLVERSRLVRTVMRKYAKIRKLKSEADSSEEEDEDAAFYAADMKETWAKIDVCMDKKSELEEHVEKEGDVEVAFVLSTGAKAELDEERLARYEAGISRRFVHSG